MTPSAPTSARRLARPRRPRSCARSRRRCSRPWRTRRPRTALVGFERYCSARSDVMPLLAMFARQPRPRPTRRRSGAQSHAGRHLGPEPRFLELLDPTNSGSHVAMSWSPARGTPGVPHQPGQAMRSAVQAARDIRICAADVLGSPTAGGEAQLSFLADACLEESLRLCGGPGAEMGPRDRQAGHCPSASSPGQAGGEELNYASDIDITFVAGDDGIQGLTVSTRRLLNRLAGVCTAMARCPRRASSSALTAGSDLRAPGPLVARWRLPALLRRARTPWERQALIKAAAQPATARWGRVRARHRRLVYQGPPEPQALRSIRHNKQQIEHRVRAADRFYSQVKEGFGGSATWSSPSSSPVRVGTCAASADGKHAGRHRGARSGQCADA